MTTAATSYIPSSLSAYPRSARIWLFGFDRQLQNEELALTAGLMNEFIDQWASHGKSVMATFAVIENRFLLIMSREEVSGCGKDDLMRTLQNLERRLDTSLLDGLRVFYRDTKGNIQTKRRADFGNLLEGGAVNQNTPVFNLGLTEFSELHEGQFERPLIDSVYNYLLPTEKEVETL